MRYIGDPRVPPGYLVAPELLDIPELTPGGGPWYLVVRDPGEPPIKPLVFVTLTRDEQHRERRLYLQGARYDDETRRQHGYRPRRFRDTLRALLTPDERAPR